MTPNFDEIGASLGVPIHYKLILCIFLQISPNFESKVICLKCPGIFIVVVGNVLVTLLSDIYFQWNHIVSYLKTQLLL